MQELIGLVGRRNFSEKYIKPLKVQVEATKRLQENKECLINMGDIGEL